MAERAGARAGRIGRSVAYLAGAALVGGLVLLGVSRTSREADGLEQFLVTAVDDPVYIGGSWLVVAGVILLLGALVALRAVLNPVSPLPLAALSAVAVGVTLIVVESMVRIGVIYELAEPLSATTGSLHQGLLAVAEVFRSVGELLVSTGSIVGPGLGVGLLAGSSLHAQTVPSWIALIGLAAAALSVLGGIPGVPLALSGAGLVLVAIWVAASAATARAPTAPAP